MNDDETFKMLLVLTDGKNETVRFSSRSGWSSTDDPSADTALTQSCEGAKTEGIEVRTIAFEVSDANIETLLKNCASTRDGVRFFYKAEEDDLKDVFRQIANDLIDLRLRK